MTTTNSWIGDAQSEGDIIKIVPLIYTVGVTYVLQIGTKSVSYTTGQVGGVGPNANGSYLADAVTGIAAAVNTAAASSGYAEFAGITATVDPSNTFLTIFGPTNGTPIEITSGSTVTTSVTRLTTGFNGQNQVQRIEIPGVPTAGSIVCYYPSDTNPQQTPSATWAYNASAATVQTALNAMLSARLGVDSAVTVTGASPAWDVTFVSTLERVNMNPFVLDGSGLTGSNYSIVVQTVQFGQDGTPMQQSIIFPPTVASGFYRLITNSGNVGVSQEAATCAWNATAATVQAALESLPSIGLGGVAVTGDYVRGFNFAFWGQNKYQNVAVLSIDTTNLIGSVFLSLTQTNVASNTFGSTGGAILSSIGVTPTGNSNVVVVDFTNPKIGTTTQAIWQVNASGSDVALAMSSLIGCSAGDFSVAVNGSQWIINFTGQFAGTNASVVPSVSDCVLQSVSGCVVSLVVGAGSAASSKTYILTAIGIRGNYVIASGGTDCPNIIPFGLTAADLQTALVGNGIAATVASSIVGIYTVVVNGSSTQGFDTVLTAHLQAGLLDSPAGQNGATITVLNYASPGTDAVQEILLQGNPSTGVFSLAWPGLISSPVNVNTNTTTFQVALDTMFGAGNTIVSGQQFGPWTVQFTGEYGGTEQPDISAANISMGGLDAQVYLIQTAMPRVDEKQYMEVRNATGGTLTMTLNGDTTAAMPFNASPSTIQRSLIAATAITAGQINVTGSAGSPWTAEFMSTNTGNAAPVISGVGTSLTGACSVTVATITNGAAAMNEQQTITLLGTITGGTFTLTFNGQTTSTLAYNAANTDVQSALQALTTIGAGNATVSGSSGGPWIVTFTSALAGAEQPLIIGDATSLTSTPAITVTEIRAAGGYDTVVRIDATGILYSATQYSVVFGGSIGNLINIGDSAGTVETAINTALNESYAWTSVTSPVPPTVSVSSPSANIYDIDFSGPFLADKNLTSMLNSGGGTFVNVLSYYDNLGSSTNTGVLLTLTTVGGYLSQLQNINLAPNGTPISGTFTLTATDDTSTTHTTGNITYTSVGTTMASAIQTALNAAWVPGPSQTGLVVTTNGLNNFKVDFGGNEGAEEVALITGNASSLVVNGIGILQTQGAFAGADEVQSVTLNGGPSGGTFTLTYNTYTTGTLAYNTSTSAVQSALQALTGIMAVTVTQAANVYTVTFTNPGDTNLVQMTGTGTGLTGCAVSVSTSGANIDQIVSFVGTPTGGTFLLQYGSGPYQTSMIAYNASAATISSALSALSPALPYSFTVAGTDPWTIHFLGVVTETGIPTTTLIQINTDSLTSDDATYISQTPVQVATGPQHFNNPNNWSLGRMPITGDMLVFANNNNPCTYGLNYPSVVPVEVDVYASYGGYIGLPAVNAGGYAEYRLQFLTIGTTSSGIMLVQIGIGNGTNPQLVQIDSGSKQTSLIVYNTIQNSNNSEAPVNWKGTHANNTVDISQGTLGIGALPGDVATVNILRQSYVTNVQSDSTVIVGSGVTLNTVTKTGGVLTVRCPIVTALNNLAGMTYITGVGTVAQINCSGDSVYYQTTGALGGNTILSGAGLLVFDGDMRPKTVTNPIQVGGNNGADVFDQLGVVNSGVLTIKYLNTSRQASLGQNYQIVRTLPSP